MQRFFAGTDHSQLHWQPNSGLPSGPPGCCTRAAWSQVGFGPFPKVQFWLRLSRGSMGACPQSPPVPAASSDPDFLNQLSAVKRPCFSPPPLRVLAPTLRSAPWVTRRDTGNFKALNISDNSGESHRPTLGSLGLTAG